MDTESPYSSPFSIKQIKDSGTDLNTAARHKHVFTQAEMLNAAVNHDANPNAIKGTDANPLHVQYKVDLNNIGWFRHNRYMELVCGEDRAPTNTIEVFNCADKYRVYLDPAGDGTVHGSIAVGVIALSDTDVCSTDGQHQVERLTVYDGKNWRYLKAENMRICKRWNIIDLTVKTNTITIRIRSKYLEGTNCGGGLGDFDNTVTIDRQYLGAFSAITMGGLPNDSADPFSDPPYQPYGGCWDGADCEFGDEMGCTIPLYNYTDWLDDVYVQDGESYYDPDDPCDLPPTTGACCRTDGTCEADVEENNCLPPDVWREGEACGDTPCCPKPWADIDGDDDVDQQDFGLWQVCFTGDGGGVNAGCECYDRDDADGSQKDAGAYDDVDATDFQWFANCVTGPTVPLDVNNPPTSCVP